MYDLHTHTTMSDGELLPTELIRRAAVLGYTIIGITDHADASNIDTLVQTTEKVRASARSYGVRLLTGVEITHVPPDEIAVLAARAKAAGADIVIVHGETTVEPVAPGTNAAACACPDVDVLAHPGLISDEDARMAAANTIALEITARGGHNRTNGHIVQVARATGCRLVVNSDGHAPGDLMTADDRTAVARGAGMTEEECRTALDIASLAWLLA
ncbi:MAG TPA: histidinol phosphate phosphatase domain-containing protein [Methanoculleus sp.]|nr:histidinol phosphate phosphatase domain-containing protein [Methanoculleus sp.]